MSLYTAEDRQVAEGIWNTLPPGLTDRQQWDVVLNAVARRVAARAVRDAAAFVEGRVAELLEDFDDVSADQVAQMLRDRADEIEPS